MVKVDDDFGQENEILVNDNLFEIGFVGIKTGCTFQARNPSRK